jgi:crotonobetainyl-CoA:carnitine CoA-transferase CaiB-like acyl-CoA transferase
MTSPAEEAPAVLRGIRILEVADYTFVPSASALLTQWGADVIKVEHVERGDAMRGLASTGAMKTGTDSVNVMFEHSNHGKRSIGLDLATERGHDILLRLAEQCDVFLTNKLAPVRSRLRIDVEDLRAVAPSIIYARGTGAGIHGPGADEGGYDWLSFWSRPGAAMGAKLREVEQIPMMPAPAYGDSISGMFLAGGVIGALFHRQRTGEALVVDVSLLGAGVWSMGGAIALSAVLGDPWLQFPHGYAHVKNPIAALSYQTSDGRWISLSCLQGFKYWPAMCEVIDRPDLVVDDRFATAAALTENAPVAAAILAEEFRTRPLDEWQKRFVGFPGQWSLVQDSKQVLSDPDLEANRLLAEVSAADGSPFKLATIPVQLNGLPGVVHRAPDFNEHGDEILRELLGIEGDELIDLKVQHVVA